VLDDAVKKKIEIVFAAWDDSFGCIWPAKKSGWRTDVHQPLDVVISLVSRRCRTRLFSDEPMPGVLSTCGFCFARDGWW
jgi:hypothetical protein